MATQDINPYVAAFREDGPPKRDSVKLTRKLSLMREKFNTIKLDSDDEDETPRPGSILTNIPEESSSPRSASSPTSSKSASRKSAKVWGKLRKIVKEIAEDEKAAKASTPLSSPRAAIEAQEADQEATEADDKEESPAKPITLDVEDIELSEYWMKADFISPPEPLATDASSEPLLDFLNNVPAELSTSDIMEEERKVTVSRVPEEVVREKQEEHEELLLKNQREIFDKVKKNEANVLRRENVARKRVIDFEQETKIRLDQERLKVVRIAEEREEVLGREFRRMKEQVEKEVAKQQATIVENFGKLFFREDTLSRKYHIFSSLIPQPVEFRIHLLRAVKTKLPKGPYVMMLSQMDALGGSRAIGWSKAGMTGIGDIRPGCTKSFYHYGRYFDRTVRVEDSVFALCPPKPLLKPSFIFLLELFQLASRDNPMDRVVGWTAVPMCYEKGSLIEGKIKLPLMTGEHSPAVAQFKDMEQHIACDLSQWIGNIYLEVRHMNYEELSKQPGTENSTLEVSALNGFELEFDFLNKKLASDADKVQQTDSKVDGGGEGRGEGGGDIESGDLAAAALGLDEHGNPLDAPPKGKTDLEQAQLIVDMGLFQRRLQSREGAGEEHHKLLPKPPSGSYDSGSDKTGKGTGKGGFWSLIGSNSNKKMATVDPNVQMHSSLAMSNFAEEKAKRAAGMRGTIGVGGSATVYPEGEGPDGGGGEAANIGGLGKSPSATGLSKSSTSKKASLFGGFFRQATETGIDEIAGLENHSNVVRERPYGVTDKRALHEHQRGRLTGLETIDSEEGRSWAKAGLEGKIVRKHASEGLRLDSEKVEIDAAKGETTDERDERDVSILPGGLKKGMSAKMAHPLSYAWTELRDPREMAEYSMSIAVDPTVRRKNKIPGAIIQSKLQYLYLEIFGDMTNSYMIGTLEWYSTIIVFVFALWVRIYVHYWTQYLYLQTIPTPLYGYSQELLQVIFKYSSESISNTSEIIVVVLGPVSNIFLFSVIGFIAWIYYHFTDYLPLVCSKFFAAFGIAAVLDPILTVVIDLIYHNYDCDQKSEACELDYTSNDCDCFEGDFIKLWNRMDRLEGSGITGLMITVIFYISIAIVACILVYHYVVYVHRDANILDLWRRVNAPEEEFFIPHDFEISSVELGQVCKKVKTWRGPSGFSRALTVEEDFEVDLTDPTGRRPCKRYIITERTPRGVETIFRQFVMDKTTGVILEIFDSDLLKAAQQAVIAKVVQQGDKQGDKQIDVPVHALVPSVSPTVDVYTDPTEFDPLIGTLNV